MAEINERYTPKKPATGSTDGGSGGGYGNQYLCIYNDYTGKYELPADLPDGIPRIFRGPASKDPAAQTGITIVPRYDEWERELSPPTGFTSTNVSSNSLTVSVIPIEGAEKYFFSVYYLDLTPVELKTGLESAGPSIDLTGLYADSGYIIRASVQVAGIESMLSLPYTTRTASAVSQEALYFATSPDVFYAMNDVDADTASPNGGSLAGSATYNGTIVKQKTGLWTQKAERKSMHFQSSLAAMYQLFAVDALTVADRRFSAVITVNRHNVTSGQFLFVVGKQGNGTPRITVASQTGTATGTARLRFYVRDTAGAYVNIDSAKDYFTGDTVNNKSLFIAVNCEPSPNYADKALMNVYIWHGTEFEHIVRDNVTIGTINLDKVTISAYGGGETTISNKSDQHAQDFGFYRGAQALSEAKIYDIKAKGTLLLTNP